MTLDLNQVWRMQNIFQDFLRTTNKPGLDIGGRYLCYFPELRNVPELGETMCFLHKSQLSKGFKGFRGMRHKYYSQNVQKNGIRKRDNVMDM